MYSPFFDKLLPAITWTLLHSLWQGLFLTLLAGLVLSLTYRSTAARRYVLLLGLFLLFMSSVVLTFFIEWNGGLKIIQVIIGAGDQNYLPTPRSLQDVIKEGVTFLNRNAGWMVLLWFLVFLYQCRKLIHDMQGVKRLRTNNIEKVDGHWLNKLQNLAAALHLAKPVLLLQSSLVKVPVTVGYFKPLILVPVGMLANMPPAQVEAVLLHELAHIRRHDYLVNLMQRMAESIFFFNPALLWVSSLLRIERETCCDELAIAHNGSKRQLVEALIHCKESSLHTPSYALGFLGPKNLLLYRLNRIVFNRNNKLSPLECAFLGFSMLLLVALALGVSQNKASQQVLVSQLNPTTQQVDISEVGYPVTESDGREGGMQKRRRLLLPPPPPVNQIIHEINNTPKANNNLRSGAPEDRIEIDLTRQSEKSKFLQVDQDRAAAEGRGKNGFY